MRKRVILVFMLVMALAVTTNCSLVVKDHEVDKQTPIVEVGGKTFTKGEVSEQVALTLNYQESYYSMFGYAFDKTDAAVISDAQDSVINALIEETVVNQKKTEMGMDTFTEEELSALQASADTTWQGYADSVKTSNFAETELTGEDLDKAIEAKMAELGYPTKEQLLEDQRANKGVEKLKAEIVKEITVTDETVKIDYDTRVTNAKAEYENNLPAYGTAVKNGSTVYYTPAGYRYVKHILRNLSDEDTAKINDLTSQLSEKQTQLTNVEGSLGELGEDASADDENTAKSRADLTGAKATLDAEMAELQKQLEQTKETAYANIQPTVDEILAKLNDGGDFDALMAEYGEDPGMQASPAKETGYLVCTGSTEWVQEFTDAAMGLAKLGDISAPIRTSYGIHILTYSSDVAEGATPYDDVKDVIHGELLTQKQNELYTQTVAQWVADAGAKIYKNRLAD